MIELKGSLRGVGLLPIVQLLAEMQETGELRVARGELTGKLVFDQGHLVAVVFGDERSLAALAALALAFPEAEFSYVEAPPPTERNLDLTFDQLRTQLSRGDRVAAPSAVPLTRPAAGAAEGRARRAACAAGAAAPFPRPPGPLAAPAAAQPAPVAPQVAPTTLEPKAAPTSSCPKLAFVDDPERRYSRPTGLHRCYATASPMLITPHEQRERCLTDGYTACPRWPVGVAATTRPLSTSNLEPRPLRVNGASGRPRMPRPAMASLADTEAPAERPSSAPSAARPSRRLLRLGGAGALLLTVLALGGVVLLGSGSKPTPDLPPSPQRVASTAPPLNQALPARATLLPVAAVAPQSVTERPRPIRASALSGPALMDVRFSEAQPSWPQNPPLAAWADGAYRVTSRQDRFTALAAPLDATPDDVIVSATFRKIGGPTGGGYGVIVRDQGRGPRDGINQGGRYYVFEAGDRGEVGAWRRDGDHWVDLLTWTPSAAVRQGGSPNDVLVRAVGDQLAFVVNGTEVLTTSDATLGSGGLGIFVGGDANAVALDRFSVQTPD